MSHIAISPAEAWPDVAHGNGDDLGGRKSNGDAKKCFRHGGLRPHGEAAGRPAERRVQDRADMTVTRESESCSIKSPIRLAFLRNKC